MRLAKTVTAALLVSVGTCAALRGASLAEDTAEQTLEEATLELEQALDEHSKVNREHVLLKQQVTDLRDRARIARARLGQPAKP